MQIGEAKYYKLIGILVISVLIIMYSVAFAGVDGMGNPSDTDTDGEEYVVNSELKAKALPPNIIHTIPSPTTGTMEIAFDGTYLWVGPWGENKLYQISPIDGTVIKTIPVTVIKPYGLAYDGSSLWLTVNESKLIKKIDPSNGNVLASFPTPANPAASYPTGLAWDGTNLWNNDPKGPLAGDNIFDSTFEITTTGSKVRGFDAYGTYPSGAAWDGHYLWLSDNPSQTIHKVDPTTFTIVLSIDAPGGQYPNGLAWDGTYLWVANNASDMLYQLDVSYGPSTIIDPDTLYSYQANIIDPYALHIYVGELGDGYTTADVDPTTFMINGTMTPDSYILGPHPDFTGDVWDLTVDRHDFIMTYPDWYDWSVQAYTVTGEYTDLTAFLATGEFDARGHISGDINNNGIVNLLDIYYLIEYIYLDGPEPLPFISAGDYDNNEIVDLGDILAMVTDLYLK